MTENPDVEQRIKHLITTQHDHERQWWKQREALLQKQRGREEERRKLDGVLYVSFSFPQKSSQDKGLKGKGYKV